MGDPMKKPFLVFGAALVFSCAVAAGAEAQNIMFNYQLVPGPSGYRGPLAPAPNPTFRQAQPARPLAQQAPALRITTPDHMATRPGHGEPDETGRIGATVHAERDADGKLLPTHHPR